MRSRLLGFLLTVSRIRGDLEAQLLHGVHALDGNPLTLNQRLAVAPT